MKKKVKKEKIISWISCIVILVLFVSASCLIYTNYKKGKKDVSKYGYNFYKLSKNQDNFKYNAKLSFNDNDNIFDKIAKGSPCNIISENTDSIASNSAFIACKKINNSIIGKPETILPFDNEKYNFFKMENAYIAKLKDVYSIPKEYYFIKSSYVLDKKDIYHVKEIVNFINPKNYELACTIQIDIGYNQKNNVMTYINSNKVVTSKSIKDIYKESIVLFKKYNTYGSTLYRKYSKIYPDCSFAGEIKDKDTIKIYIISNKKHTVIKQEEARLD